MKATTILGISLSAPVVYNYEASGHVFNMHRSHPVTGMTNWSRLWHQNARGTLGHHPNLDEIEKTLSLKGSNIYQVF